MSKFSDFGLAPSILEAVAAEGYTIPTPIQSQAIPQVLLGRDLCGIAQTGTGKTAAFALPILHRLARAPARRTAGACRALVLSPTRELASQIAESFRAYGRELPLSTAVVFGGVPIGAQQRRLAAGVDILVATPGRLLDLIDRKSLSLSRVEILVLDEADRMLDLGFIHALRRIVKLLPRQRQTLLFSATMPRTIASLAEEYLEDPAAAGAKAGERALALGLRLVSMNGDRLDAGRAQMSHDPVRTVLGAGEHEHAFECRITQQRRESVAFPIARNEKNALIDQLDRRRSRRDGHLDRVVEVLLG